jgi:hypothetical protein
MASLGLIGMVGGIGGEMVKQADEERKMAANRDFETWRMEVLQSYKMQDEARAESRTIAGEKRKVEMADTERAKQTERIDRKAGELAEGAVSAKRGLVQSGIADPDAWTPEQQAVVDQSLALDKGKIAADPETRISAAISTGDIDPTKAATIHRDDRRLDAAEKANAIKERSTELRDATQRYIADLRHADSQKRLDALIAKTGKDKDGVTEALRYVGEARKELTSEAQNLRQLMQAELKDELDPDEKKRIQQSYAPKFEAVDRKRNALEQDFNELRGKVGLSPKSEPKPEAKPEPKALPALPKGAKQIGTSGGKPVYETTDGKRFIAK